MDGRNEYSYLRQSKRKRDCKNNTEEHFDWRTPQMVEYLGLHECIDLNAIETIEKRDLSMISN